MPFQNEPLNCIEFLTIFEGNYFFTPSLSYRHKWDLFLKSNLAKSTSLKYVSCKNKKNVF